MGVGDQSQVSVTMPGDGLHQFTVGPIRHDGVYTERDPQDLRLLRARPVLVFAAPRKIIEDTI